MNRFFTSPQNQRLLAAVATISTTAAVSHYVMHHFNQSPTSTSSPSSSHTSAHKSSPTHVHALSFLSSSNDNDNQQQQDEDEDDEYIYPDPYELQSIVPAGLDMDRYIESLKSVHSPGIPRYPKVPPEYELIQAQVIHRHGVRTPMQDSFDSREDWQKRWGMCNTQDHQCIK